MKKQITLSIIALLISAISFCQAPTGGSAGKLTGFDSTISSANDVTKSYKYISPYCIVNTYQMVQSTTDSVAVVATVLLYSSQAAYISKLQPLSAIRIVAKFLANNGKLPDQVAIKKQIYALIPKQ